MVRASEGLSGQRRSRNRKRSKRRAIFCPVHNCYLDSVSQKYPLYADRAGQLQERGIGRQSAQLIVDTYGSVTLQGEWLEAFWCSHCAAVNWYHIQLYQGRHYHVKPLTPELWQQAIGVINPQGNPTVSEFTRRQARMNGIHGLKTFNFVR
jgi:hypothetical protein